MSSKVLRNGYTTGSCAAAAAKAAVMDLYGVNVPEYVPITLPDQDTATFHAEKVGLEKEISALSCFRVQKDSGDDPDVTDGIFIYAACRAITPADAEELDAHGKGYLCEGKPSIYIDGGPGIGLVTQKGLSCPVGHYAINPVPRDEIALAVREACEETGSTDDLLINIAAPEGENVYPKTFNPKLGITGGISILGTSGIVRPMSEDAVKETIRLELGMRAAAGQNGAVLVPGNYGEIFIKERLGIPDEAIVQISNFVRDSLVMACEEGLERILFAGHIGKLIKVAAGFPNTHSRYGDKRMETFISLLKEMDHPISSDDACTEAEKDGKADKRELMDEIASAATTDEALRILAASCPEDPEKTVGDFLDELAKAVKRQMEEWVGGRLVTEVIVFSRDGAIGATRGVREHFSL